MVFWMNSVPLKANAMNELVSPVNTDFQRKFRLRLAALLRTGGSFGGFRPELPYFLAPAPGEERSARVFFSITSTALKDGALNS